MSKWFYGIYYGLAWGGYCIGHYTGWVHALGWVSIIVGTVALRQLAPPAKGKQ